MGDPGLAPYVRRREELSLQNGCLLWGTRVVVPYKLRSLLLSELHSSHTGASKMKELARSYLWWPNLDADLETLAASCTQCIENRSSPPKAELHPWEWPQSPWHRIHVDYAGPVNGHYFLVVVDAHSKWVDIYPTSGTTSKETIKCLRHSFSCFGLPVSIVSDNGPCFTSGEFLEFTRNCGIRHITTAVYKPSTNGLAERMVQTFKKALKSSKEPLQLTIDRFLFNYRLTPHSTTGISPAELMFGRKLRSRLDLLWPSEQVHSRVAKRQQSQRDHHTGRPRVVNFPVESPVLFRNYAMGPKWLPATVNEKTGPISYRCTTPEGNTVRRHQDQLHPHTESPDLPNPVTPETPITSSPELPEQVKPPDSPNSLPRRSSRVKKPVQRYGC